MSKIVCDICGATYPETESQCPICGTAKAAAPAAGDTAGEGGYAYVKGGRFSKSNVKKRSNGNGELPRTVAAKPAAEEQSEAPYQAEAPAPVRPRKEESARAERPARRRKEEEDPSNNIGLIIIVMILVMAIVAVCVYIGVTWVRRINNQATAPSTSSTAAPVVDPSDPTQNLGPVSIPCTGLRLAMYEDTFTSVGQIVQLSPIVQPADTTESVFYLSGNERVATVNANGVVTAVGDGETVIYVTCGSYKVEFKVICNVNVAPPETTVPPTQPQPTEPTEPTEPPVELKLNRSDFTLTGYGSKWNLYTDGAINKQDIEWSSSDEAVAIVENGVVTAVGNGKATITAQYMGQKVTCIVRCNNVVFSIYKLSSTDITLYVNGNNTYTLQMYDADGLRIDPSELVFSVSKEGYFTVDEKGKITAIASNYGMSLQYVIVEYNGETLKCVVRVVNG